MADAASRALKRGVKVPDYVLRKERYDPEWKKYRVYRLFEGFESAIPTVLFRARIARIVGEKEEARRRVRLARSIREHYARIDAEGRDGALAEAD